MNEIQKSVKMGKAKRFWIWWSGKKTAIFKKMAILALALWFIFSVGYIVRDQWLRIQFQQTQAAYQRGALDAQRNIEESIRALMEQAEDCQPIFLTDADKRVELMKVGCE